MTDFELQIAIRVLDDLPAPPTSDLGRLFEKSLLAEILQGIGERGGRFIWNGVVYIEQPNGQLSRGSPWG